MRSIVLAALAAGQLLAAPGPVAAQAPQRPRVEDVLTLRRLLRARDWSALDSTLAELAEAARKDPSAEQRYIFAYTAFGVADSTIAPALDAWVAARPSSSYALAARADHFAARGWAARGREFADDTPHARMEVMKAWMQRAATDASAAYRRDSTNVAAHLVALNIVKSLGGVEKGRRVLDDALRVVPGSLVLRAVYMDMLRPRWGGSREEMARFADEAERYLSLNPRLRVLRGYIAMDEAIELEEADDFPGAMRKYAEAIACGEYWRFRHERARALSRMSEDARALIDFNRTLAEYPTHLAALAWRAETYHLLAQRQRGALRDDLERRAAADIRLATQLDPTDEDLQIVLRNYPQLRAHAAEATARR